MTHFAASRSSRISPAPAARPGTVSAARRPRRLARIPHRVPCRVRLIDEQTGRIVSLPAQTLNLSEGGLAVQVARDVTIGTWIETTIPMVESEPLLIHGKVVHVRRMMLDGFEVGIQAVKTSAPAGLHKPVSTNG